MAKYVVRPQSVVIEDTDDGQARVKIKVSKAVWITVVGDIESSSAPRQPAAHGQASRPARGRFPKETP